MTDRNKKSFIIHSDSLDVLDELNNEQAGMLFNAIRDYQSGKEVALTGLLKAVFIPFKNQIDRDFEKYLETCERNKNNGLRGGRPKNPTEPKKPTGFSENPTEPKKPDSDNDSDNDNKKDSDKEKKTKVNLETLSVENIKDWLLQKRTCGLYINIDEEELLERFKNFCKSNNKKYTDYVAAYRNAFQWNNPPLKKSNQQISKQVAIDKENSQRMQYYISAGYPEEEARVKVYGKV